MRSITGVTAGWKSICHGCGLATAATVEATSAVAATANFLRNIRRPRKTVAGQVPSHCDLVAHGFSLAVLRAWRLPARARKATILGARTTGDWTWLPTFFSTARAWIGGASRDWWTAP